MVKKFRRYLYSFWRDPRTWQMGRRTLHDSKDCAYAYVSRGKNRYFYHTLNVVWMERKFNAYKLSRCIYPSNYNRFWDRVRYLWKKLLFYHTPLAFDTHVRGVPVEISASLWDGKLEWCRYPMVKKIKDMFIRFAMIYERDGRTDTASQHILRLCIRIAR